MNKVKVKYLESFNQQKAVLKSDVQKCRPGQILGVKWKDAPNQVAILLEKPTRGPGDLSLKVLLENGVDNLSHSQVVQIRGTIWTHPLCWVQP
jgi:hypothetical protein